MCTIRFVLAITFRIFLKTIYTQVLRACNAATLCTHYCTTFSLQKGPLVTLETQNAPVVSRILLYIQYYLTLKKNRQVPNIIQQKMSGKQVAISIYSYITLMSQL